MTDFRRLFIGAALLACVVGARPAFAQPSAEDRASARLLAEDADRRLSANDLPGAIDLFQKAYALVPAPTLRLAQARAEAKLGRLIEAQQHMLEAARTTPQPGEPPSWASARQDATAEAAALDSRLSSLELSITAPQGVTPRVTIDTLPIGASTLGVPRALDPGAHVIHAEAEGAQTVDQTITLKEGEHQKLALTLEAIAPPTPPPPAPIPAPSQPVPPPASVEAPPAPAPPPSHEETGASGSLGWSIAGFTVGGLSLIVGSALGVSSMSEVSSIKSKCSGNSCPPSEQGQANDAATQGTVSTVLFVVAGGGALLGFLTLPRGAPHQASSASSVRLGIGPGSISALWNF
jgi:hypothetical protein